MLLASLNSVYLRRCRCVLHNTYGVFASEQQIATLQCELEHLGYFLDPEITAELRRSNLDVFSRELLTTLSEMRGVRNYEPVYPDFPRQVMEASEAELYINAIVQYFHDWLSDITGDEAFLWKPRYEKTPRPGLTDKVKLTLIRKGTADHFKGTLRQLIASNTSISDTDKADIKWFLETFGFTELPPTIPHKEVLAFVGSLAVEVGADLSRHFTTATDVLRLATAMSGGDVSLAADTKYRSFRRSERRYLLNLLERCGNLAEDMVRHKGKWLRLGERLHPGEYVKLTGVLNVFALLRNDGKVRTFGSRVELALKERDISRCLELLEARPGSLARRLDELLRVTDRRGNKHIEVVTTFSRVAERVSTPVLLQVRTHFLHRAVGGCDLRVFFPKGSVAKAKAVEDKLPSLPGAVCTELMGICDRTLLNRFSGLPKLGKCFLRDELKGCLVPFSQRSASKSLRTLTRGSRLAITGGGDTVRFFVYWKQKQGDRTDLDLSAVFFAGDWSYKEAITYYNLRSMPYRACHSGDRTSAPKGACEFIDVDIPSALAYGGRYVVMCVKSFTQQHFATLPECHAGWMLRASPNSGEVFEPKTVMDKLDISADSVFSIPLILDLERREVLWADMALKSNPRWANNVQGNLNSIGLFGKAFTQLCKPTLYDLFSLHVAARGKLVSSEAEADKVFTLEDAFALEKIGSEFLR